MTASRNEDPTLFRAKLVEKDAERVVVAIPATNYRLYLAVDSPLDAAVGQTVTGRIHARAGKIDLVRSGGRYIEPVFGRPRRLQGRILEIGPGPDQLTVNCVAPFVCTVTTDQDPRAFQRDQLIHFDIGPNAIFEPIAGPAPAGPGGKPEPTTAFEPPETVPHGHEPDEGKQVPASERIPGEKIRDAGSHTDASRRGISGEDPLPGDTRID